jgi:hypothetical protein
MTTARILRAEPLADFGAALAGWEAPSAFGVGYDGAIYAVARRPSTEALIEVRGGANFSLFFFEGGRALVLSDW